MQTLNVVAFTACIILILMWRKQHVASKEVELESLEKELVAKRKSLENLTADLASQRKRKDWLENEAERAYQRAVKLKDSLERLKEAFFFEDHPQAKPKSAYFQQAGIVSVRPPLHPPSAVIEEIESLLPELTNNAKILRSQAEVLHTYCTQLEARQSEMQQIIERSRAFGRSTAGSPPGAQLRSPLTPEQSAP
jgi:DNA repair exonuclease SbcCD ATPase subunit